VPPYLPQGQPARVITIGSAPGCPCGGTHLERTEQLEQLVVKGIKAKKGIVRIRYSAGVTVDR